MEGINICLVLLAVFCISGIGKSDTGPYIYYVDNIENDIFRVAVSGGEVERMNASRTTPMVRPYAIAHSRVSDCLYWAELEYGKYGIGRYCLSNRSSSFLSLPGVEIYGIGVDPRTGLLYVTDDSHDRILAVNFSNSSTWTVVSGGMRWPWGIAVDAAKGWLYWADYVTDHIEKVRIDGSDHRALVTSGVTDQKGIALDEQNSRLYFCGSSSVQSIRDDGTVRLTHFNDNLYNFYAIAVDQRFIYVRGYHNRSGHIWRLAKDARAARGGQLLSLVTSPGIQGIVLVGFPIPQSETTIVETAIPATTTTAVTTTTAATTNTAATTSTVATTTTVATHATTTNAPGSFYSQDIQKYLLLIALLVVSVLLVALSLCFCFFCIKSGKCGKCTPGERNTIEGQQDPNINFTDHPDQSNTETHYELMPGIDIPYEGVQPVSQRIVPPPRPHTRTLSGPGTASETDFQYSYASASAAAQRHGTAPDLGEYLTPQRSNLPPEFGTYLTPSRGNVQQPESSQTEAESLIYSYATASSDQPRHLAKPESSAAYLMLEGSSRPNLPQGCGTYLTPSKGDASQPESGQSEPGSQIYSYAAASSGQPRQLAEPKSSAGYIMMEAPQPPQRSDLPPEFGTYLTPPKGDASQPESPQAAAESKIYTYATATSSQPGHHDKPGTSAAYLALQGPPVKPEIDAVRLTAVQKAQPRSAETRM